MTNPPISTSVEGVWINEYGSIMTLTVEGERVSGVYRSTTGSTGEFAVSGFHQESKPARRGGTTLALAISWYPIGGGPPALNSHWCSAFSGQVSIADDGERMILSHALIASNAFAGRCESGSYIDKLTFNRLDAPISEAENSLGLLGPRQSTSVSSLTAECQVERDPLDGNWAARDGTRLDITVAPDAGLGFGRVSGTMTIPDSGEFYLSGVTDINATSASLERQSTAITLQRAPDAGVMALAGSLNLKTSTLSLLSLTTSSTKADSTYLQTTASSLVCTPLTFPLFSA